MKKFNILCEETLNEKLNDKQINNILSGKKTKKVYVVRRSYNHPTKLSTIGIFMNRKDAEEVSDGVNYILREEELYI